MITLAMMVKLLLEVCQVFCELLMYHLCVFLMTKVFHSLMLITRSHHHGVSLRSAATHNEQVLSTESADSLFRKSNA